VRGRKKRWRGAPRVLNVRRSIDTIDNYTLSPKAIVDPLRLNPESKVCVIRSVGGIGDVLMVTPGLRNLKEQFPLIELTFAIDRHSTNGDIYFELVKNAPFIDCIIDARYVDRKKYNVVVDVSAVCIPYERKSLPPVNRIDLFGYKLGTTKLNNPLPFYEVTLEEKDWASNFLKNFKKPGCLIGIHTASNEDKRTWSISQQLKLLRYLSARFPYLRFLVFDWNNLHNDWSEVPNVLEASYTNVRQMASLIQQCDIFICPDSGPMHIAGALSVPSVVTFGSIPPEARINHYPTHESIVLEGLNCLGCWYDACPYNIRCMNDLDGIDVGIKVMEKLLHEKTKEKYT
tara:strand:+ start:25184 stop:26215 length:1032 start_codon:yes stop_codon:yes gene_type:complete